MLTSDQDVTAERIRSAVAARYSTIGENPEIEDSIPRGRAWAEQLDYPPSLLADIPSVAVEAFTGIGAPILAADFKEGEQVLDLGCGAGMDTLLAARQLGDAGHIYAVDSAEGMIAAARRAVTTARAENVSVIHASAEALPIENESVDAVIVNGLFNLAPDKTAVARELMRVLRPGGRLVGAEIVLTDHRPPPALELVAWFR
jgi:arsenite methyltransferase